MSPHHLKGMCFVFRVYRSPQHNMIALEYPTLQQGRMSGMRFPSRSSPLDVEDARTEPKWAACRAGRMVGSFNGDDSSL